MNVLERSPRPFLALLLLSAFAAELAAQEEAELETVSSAKLVSIIAKESHANSSRINTWRCTADVVDTAEGPKKDRRVKSKVSFLYDKSLGARRYDSNHKTIHSRSKGGEDGRLMKYAMSGLVRDGKCLEVTTFGDGGRWIKLVDRLSISTTSDLLDGFYYFSDHGEPAKDRWNAIARRLAGPTSNWKATRLGNDVFIAAELNSYVVSTSKGCNITRFVSTTPTLEYTETRQFKEVKGIWVPEAIEITRLIRSKPKEETTERRVITFTSHEINEPLDAKLFIRAALNVMPRDRIIDTRTKQKVPSKLPDFPL